MPLGLELTVSLIRVESGPDSGPDLSLNQRFTPTQEIGGRTGMGARLVITLSSAPGFP